MRKKQKFYPKKWYNHEKKRQILQEKIFLIIRQQLYGNEKNKKIKYQTIYKHNVVQNERKSRTLTKIKEKKLRQKSLTKYTYNFDKIVVQL